MDTNLEILFESFLYNSGIRSQKTVKARINYIKLILIHCKPLTKESFDLYKGTRLKNGASPACINKYIQAVRSYCEFNKWDWAKDYKQYKEQPRPTSLFTADEVHRFLQVPLMENQTIENYQKWQIFWLLVIWTGCRPGEIRNMKIDQINLPSKELVLPKTKTRPRIIPLTENIIEPLTSFLPTLQGQYLFPAQYNLNKYMSHAAYEKDFDQRIKQIGITRAVRPYGFRKTAITKWLKKMKISIFDVKQLAGHAKTSTTEGYYELTDLEELREELNNNDPYLQQHVPVQFVIKKAEDYLENLLLKDPRVDYIRVKEATSILWKAIK